MSADKSRTAHGFRCFGGDEKVLGLRSDEGCTTQCIKAAECTLYKAEIRGKIEWFVYILKNCQRPVLRYTKTRGGGWTQGSSWPPGAGKTVLLDPRGGGPRDGQRVHGLCLGSQRTVGKRRPQNTVEQCPAEQGDSWPWALEHNRWGVSRQEAGPLGRKGSPRP